MGLMKPTLAITPVLVTLLLAGCAVFSDDEPERPARPPGDAAATSLLGRPLYPMAVSEERRAQLERELTEAQANYERYPYSEASIIWYGRRLAYLGRYEDAIAIYTHGMIYHPRSHKLLRHRGHRFISTRDFDRALTDLRQAAYLIRGKPDEIEPDGAPNSLNLPRSTSHSNIWYHLGLTLYLQGDYRSALAAYRNCMLFSEVNPDMLVATSHWLYMTLRRLEMTGEAQAVLSRIHEDMSVIENHAYHDLLLMYKGLRTPEELLGSGDEADRIQSATAAYGVANWYLYNGQEQQASELFHEILESDTWPAFGYIAAEAEIFKAARDAAEMGN